MFGRRWRRLLRGFRYIGPCRCGFGPHAYYVDDRGRVVHAWDIYYYDIDYLESYLKELIDEKKALEEEIEKIKAELERLKREKRD
ncbi:conserved hypothetical protein [Methanocaldococcus infernus ME]|uniref:Uncharacterized protein n=1 Tax=Methanocaldococcus infernus (strain DSM 11812 / JCM 15783 / ME) TaxID=573063 RepID=D5VU79_METIM|nr:hypothetical protein [Methanocaldococcus infernus]ADG12691.1 conserved hypothetical protein [Methanocaldococcus infernus ME]